MNTTLGNLLTKLNNPISEIEITRRGLDVSLVESFLEKEDFLVKDVLENLNIPPSTFFLKKRRHQILDTHMTEKFIRLISVMKNASEVLGKIEAKKWLYKRIPSLRNEIPITLLDTEAGHRLVEQTLLQIKHGIYG